MIRKMRKIRVSGQIIHRTQPANGMTWVTMPMTTQSRNSATVSTSPCLACHCTSGSFFSTTKGIRASSQRYERTSMIPRFGLAVPVGGAPIGGGGGV